MPFAWSILHEHIFLFITCNCLAEVAWHCLRMRILTTRAATSQASTQMSRRPKTIHHTRCVRGSIWLLAFGMISLLGLPWPVMHQGSLLNVNARQGMVTSAHTTNWQPDDANVTVPRCAATLHAMQDGEWNTRRECTSMKSREHASPTMQLRTLCALPADFHPTKGAEAELRLWQPRNCSLRLYDRRTACKLLHRIGGLQLMGDSYIRHVYMALLLTVSGDLDQGAIDPRGRRSDAVGETVCLGESQFIERFCKDQWRSLRTHPFPTGHCPSGQSVSARELDYMPLHSSSVWPQEPEEFAGLFFDKLRAPRVILVGVALHDHLVSSRVEQFVLSPLHRYVRAQRAERRPQVLLHAHHAVGYRKPAHYRATQGNDAVRRFNAQIQRALARPHFQGDIQTFDSYRLTQGAYSYDGSHYGRAVNLLKAQLLLNHLEEMVRRPSG